MDAPAAAPDARNRPGPAGGVPHTGEVSTVPAPVVDAARFAGARMADLVASARSVLALAGATRRLPPSGGWS
jgi:hypothetical protein